MCFVEFHFKIYNLLRQGHKGREGNSAFINLSKADFPFSVLARLLQLHFCWEHETFPFKLGLCCIQVLFRYFSAFTCQRMKILPHINITLWRYNYKKFGIYRVLSLWFAINISFNRGHLYEVAINKLLYMKHEQDFFL